jgi:putative thiamine transport system ATP-binding protein
MTPLVLRDIRIGVGGRALFERFDLTVAPGECVTLMGPSGCGKSTLLAFIAGTLDTLFAASGRVALGDDDISARPPHLRRVGILFQDDLLFPHLSVGGNLAFALPQHVGDRAARVEDALAEADLRGFARRDPATLSGGQRARVALMRTLLAQPRALLLDEPFNKLDARLRADFRKFVLAHAAQRRLPMLLVTHDPGDAPAGGRVLRLADQLAATPRSPASM